MNNILLSRTPDIVETTLKVSSGNKPKLNNKSRKPSKIKGLRDFYLYSVILQDDFEPYGVFPYTRFSALLRTRDNRMPLRISRQPA